MIKTFTYLVSLWLFLMSSFSQAANDHQWFVPNDTFVKTIAINKEVNAQIKTPQAEVRVTVDGVEQKFFKAETLLDGKVFVETEDFNYDGHLDLNIFYAYGYMGVNLYSKLYLFDAKTKKFNFAIEGSNLERDSATQTVRGYEKSGPSGKSSIYKSELGVLYLFETAQWVGECLQEIKRYSRQGQLLSTTMANPCVEAE